MNSYLLTAYILFWILPTGYLMYLASKTAELEKKIEVLTNKGA